MMRFAGYAAVFDTVDKGGDIIRRGAFADALKPGAERGIPLLWQHRPDRPIGRIEHLSEDGRGLRVIARLHPHAGEAARAVQTGAVRGLSFGYRVRASIGSTPRELTALDLVEVSLVTHPMHPAARVHAVEGAN